MDLTEGSQSPRQVSLTYAHVPVNMVAPSRSRTLTFAGRLRDPYLWVVAVFAMSDATVRPAAAATLPLFAGERPPAATEVN